MQGVKGRQLERKSKKRWCQNQVENVSLISKEQFSYKTS